VLPTRSVAAEVQLAHLQGNVGLSGWLLKSLDTSTHSNTQAEWPEGHLPPGRGCLVEEFHLKFLFFFDMAAVSSPAQTTTSPDRLSAWSQPDTGSLPSPQFSPAQSVSLLQPLHSSLPACVRRNSTWTLQRFNLHIPAMGERCEEEFMLSPGPLIPHDNLEQSG